MIAASQSVQLLAAAELLQRSAAVGLVANMIDVWAVELVTDEATLQRCRAVLSASEQARAARFRFAADESRFVVAHAALRFILARYSGGTDAELQFETGAQGKPRLVRSSQQAAIHFNLSHSSDVAVVAVADREVGIDVERHRTNIDIEAIAGRYFYGAEAQAIAAAPRDAKPAVFLQHWVAKEAVLKGVGLGIDAGLDGFHVCFRAPDPLAAVMTYRPEIVDPDWYVRLLDGVPNYHLAVAARGANWRTRSHFSRHDLS